MNETAAAICRFGIVDDHGIVRRALIALLEEDGRRRCVGEADSVHGGRRLIDAVPLDVVMVDLDLPDGHGLDVVRVAAKRGLPSIVLTGAAGPEGCELAIEAGATGYMLKNSRPVRLLDAIDRCAAGEVVLDELAAAHLARRLRGADPLPVPFEDLDGRETIALAALTRGENTAQIARRLRIGAGSARRLIAGLVHRLGFVDRTALILAAVPHAEALDQVARRAEDREAPRAGQRRG